MSMRYKGGVISATPPTTSTSAATGVWTLVQQMQAQGAGAWPVAPGGAGSQSYTVAGCYTWVAPACVTSVSLIAVSAGARGRQLFCTCVCSWLGLGGGGGGTSFKNNYSVTPGSGYAVTIGVRPVGGVPTYTIFGAGIVRAASAVQNSAGFNDSSNPGTYGYSGGVGGVSYSGCIPIPPAGGGGAAGYSGIGGCGGNYISGGGSAAACGGGGGGGGWGQSVNTGGGGIGLFGRGATGGLSTSCSKAGKAGSGGVNGTFTAGGAYGGGNAASDPCGGCSAALRIVWPGNTRQFPSTCVGIP